MQPRPRENAAPRAGHPGIGLSDALGPAALLALGDGVAVWRAFGSVGERAAAIVAIGCALAAAAAAALAWGAITAGALAWAAAKGPLARRHAWATPPGRPRARAMLLAAAPAAIAGGLALGATHTAHARLGEAAPLACVLAALLALGLAVRLACGGRSARLLVGTLGLALLVGHAEVPLRLWPALHASALVAAGWLLAHARAPRPRPLARTGAVALACGLTLALAAALTGARTGNVRFITHHQAPAAALLYDAVARLHPTALPIPDGDARAAARPSTPVAGVLDDANLLIVTVDALRADRPLPALWAALPGAVRFTHAYAQAPHTAFSITSLFTSRDLAHLDGPTLADTLRSASFFADAFYPAGLFFDGRSRLERFAAARFGFEWTDTRTLDAHPLTDAVLARLKAPRWRSQPRAFIWAHYFDPHEPYQARDGVSPDASPRARYDSEVAYTDRELGRLVRGLAGGLRPTLIVVTADHGEEFGEHGGAYHGTSLYEEQVRVPLLIAVAGGALPARTIDSPVELLDVVPTVLELLGVERPAGLVGRSLAAALVSGAPIEPAFAHAEEHTLRMLVRDGYKLIHDQRGDIDELYDLAADPREQRNRIDDEPERARALHAALDRWFGLPSPGALAARLGDRGRPVGERLEAARALAERQAPEATDALRGALEDGDAEVRAEAALALAELADSAARAPLVALLDDPAHRRRAALALGHLRDARAVPALLECTRDLDATRRRHALHYLGWLGGDAERPPIEERSLADLKVRAEAYLALGRIAQRTGSAEAAAFLAQRFAVEEQEDARQALAWAIGLAGTHDRPTIERLRSAALAEPPLPNAAEALARVGLGARGVQGRDFACWRSRDEQRFAGATTCLQAAPLTLEVEGEGGALLLVAGRALDDAPLAERVLLDGHAAGALTLSPMPGERRLALTVPPGRHRLTLAPDGGLAELDHVLLLTAPTP